MMDSRIRAFLGKLAVVDGTAPLSDAKTVQLAHPERLVVIEEDDEVVALAVTARHLHDDASHHWAIETALTPGLRFPAFEDRLLETALGLAPSREAVSIWSHRHSLDAALQRAGFAVARELGRYVVELPLSQPIGGFDVRSFELPDTSDVLAINREAYAGHREASSLDEAELRRLLGQEGLGSDGFLLADEADTVVGFCWTRVHANGDGEIYRIAVAPKEQGKGLGRSLVLAGFDFLSNRADVTRGTLWADIADKRAVSLYASIGMKLDFVNREFERP